MHNLTVVVNKWMDVWRIRRLRTLIYKGLRNYSCTRIENMALMRRKVKTLSYHNAGHEKANR